MPNAGATFNIEDLNIAATYLEWFSGQLLLAFQRLLDFRDLDVNIKMHAMLKSRVPCPWYDDEVIGAMLDVTLPWGGQLSVAEVGGW